MASEEENTQSPPVIAISGFDYSVWDQTVEAPPSLSASVLERIQGELVSLGESLGLRGLSELAHNSPDAFRYIPMGALYREELRRATESVLERIAERLQSRATRNKFFRLLKPDGQWVFDCYEFALRSCSPEYSDLLAESLARLGVGPKTEWRIDDAGSRVSFSPEVGAAYDLYRLRCSQPRTYSSCVKRIATVSGDVARAIEELTGSLVKSQQWCRRVISFLLYEKWIPEGQGLSLYDLIDGFWGRETEVRPPDLSVVSLGYPDACFVDHLATRVLSVALTGVNPRGRDYVERLSSQGRADLLCALPMSIGIRLNENGTEREVVSWRALFKLGLIGRRRQLRFDPAHVISALPELIVHELHHCILSELRPALAVTGGPDGTVCRLEIDSSVEEGFAELFSTEILGRIFDEFPVIRFFNRLRLVSLGERDPRDPHVWGYTVLADVYEALGRKPRHLVAQLRKSQFLLDGLLAESAILRGIETLDSRYRQCKPARRGVRYQVPGTIVEIDDAVRIRSIDLVSRS